MMKGLDGGHHTGAKLGAGCGLEVFKEGLDGGPAEFPQKPAFVLEEDPQYLRHGEDNLAVGNIKKKLLSHPLGPFLPPLRMARWAKSPGTTGKHDKPLFPARRAANAGKPVARVAAVQIALHHFFDDGTEEAVLSLETGLIFGQELFKVMEEHPVEHGAFRMSGTVNSCHSKESSIKKRANPLQKRLIAEMTQVSGTDPLD